MSNIFSNFYYYFASLLSRLNGNYGKGRKKKEENIWEKKENMGLDVKEKRRESEKCILHFYLLKL